MKRIAVGSTNPVKVSAAVDGFSKIFPDERFEVHGISVPSGVADQPRSEAETLRGALGRAEAASREFPEADFWVGLEGGIEEKEAGMETFAWIAVKSKEGRIGRGRTGTFFLPPRVVELIREGKELGEADDAVFGMANSKQGIGAVGILTGGAIDRRAHYAYAVTLALVPFRNPEFYPHAEGPVSEKGDGR